MPDSDKPSIARPTGTPPAHVTPAQAGVAVHGLSLGDAQPTKPAAVQLAAVMAVRREYRDVLGPGGGGGGMGHALPSAVPVVTDVTLPPSVALKRDGKGPQRPLLLLTVSLVRPASPPAQDAGTVPEKASYSTGSQTVPNVGITQLLTCDVF